MISCAAIQKLERYGYLGLKRHSTEDFVATSIKDTKRSNVYALTLLETWKEAVQAVHGHSGSSDVASSPGGGGSRSDDRSHLSLNDSALMAAPARFTDALVYAMSFAVALTTQHVLDVTTITVKAKRDTPLFSDSYPAALQLLTTLKDMALAIGSGRALRTSASSSDFTKAVAHLLANVLDLVLVLLATHPHHSKRSEKDDALLHRQMLAQGLVLTASVAQMLRRVQASYPVADLYSTRPCAALLKQVANKFKQQQKSKQLSSAQHPEAISDRPSGPQQQEEPLFMALRHYVGACAHAAASSPSGSSASAANLFSAFSLFQRLGMLHGALSAVTMDASRSCMFPEAICRASEEVQHWLSKLLSSTACSRAIRYVVYFREDELRLMQHNIRQASEYALYTFTTTPPVDPGLVEPLLGAEGVAPNGSSADDVTRARAALVLAQWCVSTAFFFESFCLDETWASFAQEQRRLVLLQQSRARRGLEKTSRSKKDSQRKSERGHESGGLNGSRSPSVSSRSSDDASASTNASNSNNTEHADAVSLVSLQAASDAEANSVGGSVTSLASRVSLLSTFSKHSAASYLSFLSVVRPSTAGSVAGGTPGRKAGAGGGDGDLLESGERQLHESEDGNTNLPLILLEQLTLGLHRFMEAYPVELLDAYGLRSISWSCIARMFAFVEASLANTSAAKSNTMSTVTAATATGLPQPLFSLAQDIRYNKGMGYECLGLLFAKAVAPLLDVNHDAQTLEQHQQQHAQRGRRDANGKDQGKRQPAAGSSSESDVDRHAGACSEEAASMRSVDGNRTEVDFFANAAAASAAVGRANLLPSDDPITRRHIEEALSTCLTAYETVAPQVVDMNLATILRLAALTANATASHSVASEGDSASWSSVLIPFLQDITRRLGRSNELPHFVDALLGRGEAAAAATMMGSQQQHKREVGTAQSDAEELLNLEALRSVFRLSPVRRALTEAAGVSLDPESLLLHLTNIASELEEGSANEQAHGCETKHDEEKVRESESSTSFKHASAHIQRTLLTLEVIESVLEGIVPTPVSACAVLEQTTQLELLLTSSFMKCVEAAQQQAASAGYYSQQQRLIIIHHACTIRQCRAVTALCLQDLGSQQILEYLVMLDETLWQLGTDIGQLIGTLTITELQPFLGLSPSDDMKLPSAMSASLLLPSLVLQRLSLARSVTASLGTTAGPAQQLREMVAYIWNFIQGKDCTDKHHYHLQSDAEDYASLLLANQMSSEDWVSVVALGKEKHARAAMMALLARSSMMSVPASSPSSCAAVAPSAAGTALLGTVWMSCCLRCIPGTALRALVDVYVNLSAEALCDAVLLTSSKPEASVKASLAQQWSALGAALIGAYEAVGHNPYWPSVLTHTVRAISHLERGWRKCGQSNGAATVAFTRLAEQLLGLVLCVVRSEARAAEVMRKTFLTQIRESASRTAVATTQSTLSRSGVSTTYVESIKVPAATLSDLAAPAPLAEADADTLAERLAFFKSLSFEEELRDLCDRLFNDSFVKQLFSLVCLAKGMSAVPGMCMSALAFLYQVSLATAQTAWRTRVTDGSLTALRETAAVKFQRTVANAFHERAPTAMEEHSSSNAAALMAFLESFHVGEDGLLFLHIASQRTNAAAAAAEDGALDDVEGCWKGIFCQYASCVAAMMMRIDAARAASAASTDISALTSICEVFCVLFARLLASAQYKQHQMSKGSRHSPPTATSGNNNGAGKRSRYGGALESSAEASKQNPSGPSANTDASVSDERAAGMDTCGGAMKFLREVLSGFSASRSSDGTNKTDHEDHARQLGEQLSKFFCLKASGNAASTEAGSVHHWHNLSCRGGEVALAAWWLLWKLFTTSTTETAKPEDVLHVHGRVQALLAACGKTAAEDAVALRAGSKVLQVSPPDTVPPFFFDHLNEVLRRVIPDPNAGASIAVGSSGAVIAAAELLLQLFRVRPRLPAWRLLPHAQRLLVWLTHPQSRLETAASALRERANAMHDSSSSSVASGPSVCLLGIRLCSAVAAHPLLASSSLSASRSSASELMSEHSMLPPARSSQSSRRSNVIAGELLDNVWLLILSLLQGSTQKASPPSTTAINRQSTDVVELQEPEIIQLILLLTKTWLRSRQQQLWSRPAMLPPVMCALFACIMRGMESARYSPCVLNVLAGGLAAMAAHVDAATAAEGDDAEQADENESDSENFKCEEAGAESNAAVRRQPNSKEERIAAPSRKRQKAEKAANTKASYMIPTVSAQLKRMALTATTAALFEVAQHYVHVFTTFSSDMDFLFTDFLRVLSQHFLPKVTRPPIAYRAGVRIGGSTQSDMSFADLAYMCVGNTESKSLLKQAALRMEEEDGGAVGTLGLTDGSRSIFHVA
ncbi:hypothetical protein ABL78_0228 [Leptomonas seymouri]|uniref:Uncharacterized protein n=1 Tax=Leptomonas seymouri TaxID=5684 RepID=A0A0N1I3Z3_LEPSE|nr:hypothetical protein ABL78_0228 [Leptomonas seymouri]|eukprot:KPI90632.1 hypothetical protein ABL78_0228 [Leptomonas seymouri]